MHLSLALYSCGMSGSSSSYSWCNSKSLIKTLYAISSHIPFSVRCKSCWYSGAFTT